MPMLRVPYESQWGLTRNLERTDCGVACVLSVLDYYYKSAGLTVDLLAAQTALANRDNGLTPQALVELAARHNLKLAVQGYTRLSDIRAEIDNGRPVIALIAYRYILGRLDQHDKTPGSDGHFIVLLGYDDSHFIADDPDYWAPYTERGHNALIPITELQAAIDGANDGGRCVFSKEVDVPLDPAIKTKLQAAQTAIEEALILIDGAAPAPVPAPAPTTTLYVTSTAGLRIHREPDKTSPTIGSYGYRATVVVESQSIAGTDETGQASPWGRIAQDSNPTLVGGYVIEKYLSASRPA